MKIGDLVRDSHSGRHGVIVSFIKKRNRTPFHAEGGWVEVLFDGEILIGPKGNLEVINEDR